ncbi:hypothetical protein GGR50DRAFT_674665 [Xylaria sp. CBS 124048]|nr:hypothetical protein GGR50DRAFT_674665 [Xylaria sp. CBS 124048]
MASRSFSLSLLLSLLLLLSSLSVGTGHWVQDSVDCAKNDPAPCNKTRHPNHLLLASKSETSRARLQESEFRVSMFGHPTISSQSHSHTHILAINLALVPLHLLGIQGSPNRVDYLQANLA